MKIYLFVLAVAFNLVSCADSGKNPVPEKVLEQALEQLNHWETLSFAATTTNTDFNKPVTRTVYKLKRVPYEPHLKLFFFKEMNKEVAIYYKLASLSVVENNKKKITTFDYGKDRSIPKYLKAYMGDDDNLLVTTKLMNEFKNEIVFVEKVSFADRQAYVYAFQNYKIWIDAELDTPLKLEINNSTSGTKDIIYEGVVFNASMDDDTFTHPESEGYVSTVFGIKKEPMLNVKAPEWRLLDLNGKEVSLKDFKGAPIFLEAWVSSCSHCMESLPKVKEIQKEFGDKVKVVTVNFDYDLQETKEAVTSNNINYMVLQGDAIFDQNYDLRSFPSYFVIDSSGTIVFSERGTIEGKKAIDLFKALITVK